MRLSESDALLEGPFRTAVKFRKRVARLQAQMMGLYLQLNAIQDHTDCVRVGLAKSASLGTEKAVFHASI